jgi:hypothetical protein
MLESWRGFDKDDAGRLRGSILVNSDPREGEMGYIKISGCKLKASMKETWNVTTKMGSAGAKSDLPAASDF